MQYIQICDFIREKSAENGQVISNEAINNIAKAVLDADKKIPIRAIALLLSILVLPGTLYYLYRNELAELDNNYFGGYGTLAVTRIRDISANLLWSLYGVVSGEYSRLQKENQERQNEIYNALILALNKNITDLEESKRMKDETISGLQRDNETQKTETARIKEKCKELKRDNIDLKTRVAAENILIIQQEKTIANQAARITEQGNIIVDLRRDKETLTRTRTEFKTIKEILQESRQENRITSHEVLQRLDGIEQNISSLDDVPGPSSPRPALSL